MPILISMVVMMNGDDEYTTVQQLSTTVEMNHARRMNFVTCRKYNQLLQWRKLSSMSLGVLHYSNNTDRIDMPSRLNNYDNLRYDNDTSRTAATTTLAFKSIKYYLCKPVAYSGEGDCATAPPLFRLTMNFWIIYAMFLQASFCDWSVKSVSQDFCL